LAAALLVPAVAAIHGIVLAILHVSGEFPCEMLLGITDIFCCSPTTTFPIQKYAGLVPRSAATVHDRDIS
jgi:hypothetical protein